MGIFDDVLNSAKTGNFEEVLTKTKTYAEDAAKKSAERLEISKKKIELLDSKTKLVKAYENYGRLQYALVEGDEVSPEELKTVEEEIQLQKNRTEYLDAEVEELRQKFLDSLSRKNQKIYERRRSEKEAVRQARRDARHPSPDISIDAEENDE